MNAPRLLVALKIATYFAVLAAAGTVAYRFAIERPGKSPAPVVMSAPIATPVPVAPVKLDAAPPPVAPPDAAPAAVVAPPKPKAPARVYSRHVGSAFWCRVISTGSYEASLCQPSENACQNWAMIKKLRGFKAGACYSTRTAWCYGWQKATGKFDMVCANRKIDCEVWAEINNNVTSKCYHMDAPTFVRTAIGLNEDN